MEGGVTIAIGSKAGILIKKEGSKNKSRNFHRRGTAQPPPNAEKSRPEPPLTKRGCVELRSHVLVDELNVLGGHTFDGRNEIDDLRFRH